MKWKFYEGQRVQRAVDVFNPKSKMKHGEITRRYSVDKATAVYGGTALGPYPELYDVRWDDGTVEQKFLPHGLDAEPWGYTSRR